MGNLNQAFKCMCTTLFFLLLFFSYTVSSSHSSTQEHLLPQNQNQNQNPSSTTLTHYHQVFYLKNTEPMFLMRRKLTKERVIKKRRRIIKRNKNMMKKHGKKISVKNMQSRGPFSAMLPKGFVPPSGSSPCHNDQPNSVSFHCHLTTAETEP